MWVATFLDHLHCTGSVVELFLNHAVETTNELLTLSQSLLMRVDAAHIIELGGRMADEAVLYTQIELAENSGFPFHQKIPDRVDSAGQRVLQRGHAVHGEVTTYSVEQILERFAGNDL